VWEEGTRVFWALEQTTATSKCEAGLSCYGGQQTDPTSAVALLNLLPLILLRTESVLRCGTLLQ
jgi:hypothetical protein